MAQEDLITTFYDLTKITQDTDIVIKQLNDVLASVKRINTYKMNLDGSKSIRDVTEATRSYRSEQNELLKIQNDIDKAYRKRMAAETELGKILAEEKELLRQATAEQKNLLREQNASQGSIEQLRAQLIRLNKEYDNLSQSERQAATGQSLQTRIGGLSTELKELEGATGRFQRNVGNYAGSMSGLFDKVIQEMARLKVEQKGLQDLSQRNPIGFSIGDQDRLNKVTASLQNLQRVQELGFKTSGNFTGQVKNLGAAIGDLEKSGAHSAEFVSSLKNEVSKAATAAGVSTVQLGVFGQAAEKTGQKAEKMGSGFSKAYGVFRQIANVLPGVGLSGLLLVLIDPVIAGVKKLFDYLTTSKTKAQQLAEEIRSAGNEITQEAAKSASADYAKLELLRRVITDLNLPIAERNSALKQYNEIAEVGNKLSEKEINNTYEVNKVIDRQIDLIKQRALARASEAIVAQKAQDYLVKLEKARADALDQYEARQRNGLVLQVNRGGGAKANAYVDAIEKQGAIEQEAANSPEVQKAKEAMESSLSAALQFQLDFTKPQTEDKKQKKKKDTNQAYEDMKAEFETYRAAQERLAELFLEGANDEKDSYQNRIFNLGQYLRVRQNLAGAEAEIEIKNDKLSNKEKEAVYQKGKDQQIQATLDSEKILQKIQEDHLKDLAKQQGGEVDLYSSTYKKLHEKLQEYLKKRGEAEAKANLKSAEDYQKAMADAQKKLGEELGNLAFDLLGDSIERQKNAIQEQMDAIDKKKEKELAAANASIGSAQDKANAIAVIEARAAAQHEQLDRKQRQLDEQKAKFDKARSIAEIIESTTVAIVKTLAEFPGPKGVALAAIIGAIGAAQLARVIAQPIPKYFKGKNVDDFYEGPAWVGDGGRSEAIIRENGDVEITPSTATLTHVGKRDIILPDAGMLAAAATRNRMNYIAQLETAEVVDQVEALRGDVRAMSRNVVKAIKGQQSVRVTRRNPIKDWMGSGKSWDDFKAGY